MCINPDYHATNTGWLSFREAYREDLVRAWKNEQILRDNKKLFANNQDLVVNNLATLQSLQASKYAQILNPSLQIALSVQAELRNLTKV